MAPDEEDWLSEATPLPDAEQAPQPIFSLDDLEAGDLEDMEEYVGQPILPLIRAMFVKLEETGGDLFAAVSGMPIKAISALLGVARRKQDPTFTQERWRTVKFADIFPKVQEEPATDPPVPAPAAADAPTPLQSRRRGKSGSSGKQGKGDGKSA